MRIAHSGLLVEPLRVLGAPFRRLHRATLSARARILTSFIVLLSLSTVVSVAAIRQLLQVRLDDRVQQSLTQEVQEFRRLAAGPNPATGRAFAGNVEAVFDAFLAVHVPGEGEALLTFVGDEFHGALRSRGAEFALEHHPDALARIGGDAETDQFEVDTPDGPARLIAVPVLGSEGRSGTFLVANFTRGEEKEVMEAVQIAGGVGAGVLLLASVLAFFAAGRVLAPVRKLTSAARASTESDLTQRIQVAGQDELSALARTFNEMLDRLQFAFESQRDFLNDASHELRTPITIIRGHLEVMGDDPQEREETIALVTDELARMTRMVDELLLLAKAERPDFLVMEEVALPTLTREFLAKAGALGDRDWRLEESASGSFLGDRERLTEAMMNLAQNAVEHTEPGDRITLGTARRGGEIHFWVSDPGPGIDPAEHDVIFERFGSVQRRKRSAGSGLGLAIVRAIAQAHGGRVTLESRLGAGSTFTVILPGGAKGKGSE